MLTGFVLGLISFVLLAFTKKKVYRSLVISSFIFYFYCFCYIALWKMPSDVNSLFTPLGLSHEMLNVIFLIPFGIYLVELLRIDEYSLLLLISILIPFVIEGSQELLKTFHPAFIYHRFDMMDVYCNALGCLISSFAMLTIRKLVLKFQPENSKQKSVEHS